MTDDAICWLLARLQFCKNETFLVIFKHCVFLKYVSSFLLFRPCYFGFPGNCGDILKAAKWKNLGLRPNVTYLPTKPAKFWLVNTPRLSSRLCTITTLTFGNFSCVSSSTLSSSWWSFPSLTYFWADNFGGTDGEFGTITRINNISVRDQKSMQDQRQCVHYFLQSLRKPVFYFLSRIKRPTN